MVIQRLDYSAETVRKHDPDRFLLGLFAAAERRPALWALYAFNHEIAKTREVVTNTQLGLIRLQWWRDALAAIYGGGAVPRHQIVEPLAAAVRQYNLPREAFDNLVYAREFDIEDRLPANLPGMVKYAEFTAAPLTRLSLDIQGVAADAEASRAVSVTYALTGILRATPVLLQQRRCYLPEDLIGQQGITVYDLYDGTGMGKLSPVAEAVAKAARAELTALPKKMPGPLRLMAKLADMHLKQIEDAGYDLFAPRLQMPPAFKALRLTFCHYFP